MGKYINELRRKTTNDTLSKRAKELVKKWRNAVLPVLPEANGQIKQSPPLSQTQTLSTHGSSVLLPSQQEDINLNQLKAKKRPAKDSVDAVVAVKRVKLNGGISELDFSDNSNSSFKDVISSIKTEPKPDVIIINSDSNSSMSEKHDPLLDQQMPKKRGRKKGSKNHKNLIDEAESSFTNKLAVSRGNSKVKTTQELIAGLQSKNCTSIIGSLAVKSKEDLVEKAAKLTERVSIIDQQLNTNRTKNSQRNKFKLEKNERVIESGSVINDKTLLSQSSSPIKEEKDLNVVDLQEEVEIKQEIKEENQQTETTTSVPVSLSLSIEEAFKQLPPIDKSVLLEDDEEPRCSCILKENRTDFSVEDDPDLELTNKFEFIEDHDCRAKYSLREKYHLDNVSEDRVHRLHTIVIPNVNGNISLGPPKSCTLLQENGLYVNVVPNVNIESIPKDIKDFSGENFSRYSFSENASTSVSDPVKNEPVKRTGDKIVDENVESFREWHEVIELPSYEGEILKILPYVIID